MSFWNPKAPTAKDYFDAATAGYLEKVKECVNNGIKTEAKNYAGWTALHFASDKGRLEVVRYLIEAGLVGKEARDNGGWTPLHRASKSGHLDIVKYFVETCKVDKGAKTTNDRSAYDIAMANNKSEVAQYLLKVMKSRPVPTVEDYLQAACDGNLNKVSECIIKGVDKEAKGNDGWTSLLYASFFGHLDIVKYLIEICLIDTEAKDINGQSAYDIAVTNNKSEVAQYFLEVTQSRPKRPAPTVEDCLQAACDGNLDKVRECISNGVDKEAKGNDGWTSLLYASFFGRLEVVKYLIETCHVDTGARAYDGQTALHCATGNGSLGIVIYLIETCFVDKDVKDNDGHTALHCASDNGHLEIVKYLIETCLIDKEAKDIYSQSAYDIAVTSNKSEVAQYLLKVTQSRPKRPAPTVEDCLQAACDGNLDKVRECISNGVDKEAKGNDGWTSLLYASFFGRLEVVKYLIETCHVDTGARAYDGQTALHCATGNGSLGIVIYLIETCFVDKDVKDNDGHTALHCASDNGHLEIVKYLIETCLIDKEAKDIYSQSAYDIAVTSNKSEVAQYLLKVRLTSTSVTQPQAREEELKSNQPLPTEKEFFGAAKEGNLDKLKHCVNNGMNKEAKDNDEWRALHFASWKGHLEIVKYLIETCLVEKDARNNLGSTALHIATRNGHLEIVKYLIETGQVNKEAKTKNGQSAYDIAATYGNSEVVQYLLNARENAATVNSNVNVSPTPLEKATIDMVRCATTYIDFPFHDSQFIVFLI